MLAGNPRAYHTPRQLSWFCLPRRIAPAQRRVPPGKSHRRRYVVTPSFRCRSHRGRPPDLPSSSNCRVVFRPASRPGTVRLCLRLHGRDPTGPTGGGEWAFIVGFYPTPLAQRSISPSARMMPCFVDPNRTHVQDCAFAESRGCEAESRRVRPDTAPLLPMQRERLARREGGREARGCEGDLVA